MALVQGIYDLGEPGREAKTSEAQTAETGLQHGHVKPGKSI
jgi:hypothetical protein